MPTTSAGSAARRGARCGRAATALATDAVTAATLLRAKYPRQPIYLLGESMGGAVAILAATGAAGIRPAAVDGVILSAPAVWTRDSMQFLPRIALWAGVRMFPGAVFTGESLHILASDNIPMLIALGKDPMVIKGARVDTMYGLVNLMDATIAAAPRLTQPLFLMYGANDAVIPADAAARVRRAAAGRASRARPLCLLPARLSHAAARPRGRAGRRRRRLLGPDARRRAADPRRRRRRRASLAAARPQRQRARLKEFRGLATCRRPYPRRTSSI